ncbi:MAG: ABC transporter permease [Clostridiales bacterium]
MKKSNIQNVSISMVLLKGRTLIALIVIILVFSMISPGFLSAKSLILVTKHSAITTIIALGMTLVIISGGIDLSVGSIIGLTAMISGGLIYKGIIFGEYTVFLSIPLIIILSLFVGIVIGFLNGWLISYMKVPAFIATLGTMYVARGAALLRSGGETFPNLSGKSELGNTGFELLGAGTFLNIPYSIWIMVLLIFLAIYVTKKTPLGWHIFAVGGNERAAKLSGIEIRKTKIFVYIFSGVCASIVGLIVASQLVAAHPATGETWEMNAIAAAVLGGTSMSGGVGTIGGTVIGGFIIGVLNDGMVMMGISSFWQMVIKGMVIVIAVITDMSQRKLQAKMALAQQVKD